MYHWSSRETTHLLPVLDMHSSSGSWYITARFRSINYFLIKSFASLTFLPLWIPINIMPLLNPFFYISSFACGNFLSF